MLSKWYTWSYWKFNNEKLHGLVTLQVENFQVYLKPAPS